MHYTKTCQLSINQKKIMNNIFLCPFQKKINNIFLCRLLGLPMVCLLQLTSSLHRRRAKLLKQNIQKFKF